MRFAHFIIHIIVKYESTRVDVRDLSDELQLYHVAWPWGRLSRDLEATLWREFKISIV